MKNSTENRSKKAESPIGTIARYTIAGGQAGRYEKITKAIGEHVGKVYGYEMKVLILEGTETVHAPPPQPSGQATKYQEVAWGKEYDAYLKDKKKYDDDKAKIFATIFGHCDDAMKNWLESREEYRKADQQRNVIALLKMIKEASYDDDRKYPARQAVDALKQLMKVWQGEQESLPAYYRRVKSLVERVELSYGELAPTTVATREPKYKKDAGMAMKRARDKMVAYLFVQGANKIYKPLLKGLDNDYTLGDDRYPETIEEAMTVLTEYGNRNGGTPYPKKQPEEKVELNFAQMSVEEMRRKGLCYKCGKKGHRAFECKKVDDNKTEQKEETQHAMVKEEEQGQQYDWMN